MTRSKKFENKRIGKEGPTFLPPYDKSKRASMVQEGGGPPEKGRGIDLDFARESAKQLVFLAVATRMRTGGTILRLRSTELCCQADQRRRRVRTGQTKGRAGAMNASWEERAKREPSHTRGKKK